MPYFEVNRAGIADSLSGTADAPLPTMRNSSPLRRHIVFPSISTDRRVSWRSGNGKPALYEIFRKDLLGTPVWMESAQDLESAELRMNEFVNRSPGQYFIACHETGEI